MTTRFVLAGMFMESIPSADSMKGQVTLTEDEEKIWGDLTELQSPPSWQNC